jgi:hypothetical protein
LIHSKSSARSVLFMLGKRAKILSDDNIQDLLAFTTLTRYPIRNRVMVLLSVKAGLRAGEIANLTWAMVTAGRGDWDCHCFGRLGHQKEKWPGHSPSPRLGRRADGFANRDWRKWTCDSVRAEHADDTVEHRQLVHNCLSGNWRYWLLVSLRAKNVCHPGREAGPHGRWVVTGCSDPRRSPIDSDNSGLHRRRYRRSAPVSGVDLTCRLGWPFVVRA